MTPDEERLQRYLEWRRAGDRDRSERRRRAIGYVVVPALCVIAVGLAAWLGRPSTDRSPVVSAVAPAIPRESAPSSPAPATESGTSPAAEQPAVSAPRARPRPRTAPPVASRPRVRPAPSARPVQDTAPAAPSDGVIGESDVAAAVAPAPVSPPSETPREAPSERRHEAVFEQPREAPSQAEALPAPTPAPSDVVALPAPDRADAVQNPVAPTTPPSGGAVAVAPSTVRQRVTSWAKGEVQEFRDGVKREIRDVRSGYEKVRDFFRR